MMGRTTAMTAFLDALAFLTRLAPARPCSPAALTRCVPWFAPVGLVLGCLCTAAASCGLAFLFTLPAYVATQSCGLFVTALLWLALELWITRGLHWDGLADLGDAVGAGGSRFWEILRDSRIGAFGALSLLVVFCGQWAALAWHLGALHRFELVLAPVWGRACAIWLAARTPARTPDSLGGLVQAGASPALARLHGLAALLLAGLLCVRGLGFYQSFVLLIGQYTLTRTLSATARRQGGLSGDFLGASIELGQLWFLLVTL